MRLIVTTESRFQLGNDGVAYCDTGTRGYPFWTRYLDVFDAVTVLARRCPQSGRVSVPVEGPGVTLCPLPGYVGPEQYLRNWAELKRRVREVCAEPAAVVLHSGAIGGLVWQELRSSGRPYGMEVVGDPYDVFAPGGGVRHPLRAFFRWWSPWQLRRQCREAAAVSYVTEQALQRRYPTRDGGFSVQCSDVNLPEEAFVPEGRRIASHQRSFTLVTVGSMAQLYKAPDVLIKAVAECAVLGLDLQLVMVGDGQYRGYLEGLAKQVGVGDRVVFRGQLPSGQAVRDVLDTGDLFVLPSLTEGLPRALLEAMARGLPCVASAVGGIPELLASEDLVSPGDVAGLVRKLREVLTTPERMCAMADRNLLKAQGFSEDRLRSRRLEFLRFVKDQTADWFDLSS